MAAAHRGPQLLAERAEAVVQLAAAGPGQTLGMRLVDHDGHVVIASVSAGSPADRAGLQPDMEIVAVDGRSLAGLLLSETLSLVRQANAQQQTLALTIKPRPEPDSPPTPPATAADVPPAALSSPADTQAVLGTWLWCTNNQFFFFSSSFLTVRT